MFSWLPGPSPEPPRILPRPSPEPPRILPRPSPDPPRQDPGLTFSRILKHKVHNAVLPGPSRDKSSGQCPGPCPDPRRTLGMCLVRACVAGFLLGNSCSVGLPLNPTRGQDPGPRTHSVRVHLAWGASGAAPGRLPAASGEGPGSQNYDIVMTRQGSPGQIVRKMTAGEGRSRVSPLPGEPPRILPGASPDPGSQINVYSKF